MNRIFERTEILLHKDALSKLSSSKVAVFGVGGVGGYVVEALVRSGVGNIVLVDNDTVSETNINRQIIATTSTVGRYKVDVCKERILDINPKVNVETHKCFLLPENSNQFDFSEYSYIADCVDTVTAKIELVLKAKEFNVPIISSMGTGNKLDPCGFMVDDINNTSICPLAKVMRKELKKRNINNLKVVYSREEARKSTLVNPDNPRKMIPGSVSFVPAVAGLIMAGEIIKDIINSNAPRRT